jgi:hypothetical protein
MAGRRRRRCPQARYHVQTEVKPWCTGGVSLGGLHTHPLLSDIVQLSAQVSFAETGQRFHQFSRPARVVVVNRLADVSTSDARRSLASLPPTTLEAGFEFVVRGTCDVRRAWAPYLRSCIAAGSSSLEAEPKGIVTVAILSTRSRKDNPAFYTQVGVHRQSQAVQVNKAA